MQLYSRRLQVLPIQEVSVSRLEHVTSTPATTATITKTSDGGEIPALADHYVKQVDIQHRLRPVYGTPSKRHSPT
jgi:hypothetical protein